MSEMFKENLKISLNPFQHMVYLHQFGASLSSKVG